MEMNNLIFILIFAMVISYATVLMITDSGRTTSYLVSPNSTFNVTELQAAVNEMRVNVSTIQNETTISAREPNSAIDQFAQLAGVATNIFNSAVKLLSLAAVLNSFVAMLLAQTGGLVPAEFLFPVFYLATGAVVLIGILYYLAKVK